MARLVEVLQPLSLRADRLAGMEAFAGLRWSDLEWAAETLAETTVERGTRLSVQGRRPTRLWLIIDGEALVSKDARPIRVAASGDAVGLKGMLNGRRSPETAIALSPMRALVADAVAFQSLLARPSIGARLLSAAKAVDPGR